MCFVLLKVLVAHFSPNDDVHVSKVTNSIQVPNMLSLLNDTHRLCDNFCQHLRQQRAELPGREQAELRAKKIIDWTPVARIKLKQSECASWPLQDNFGGMRVPGAFGSEAKMPIFQYWEVWSKMLFIRDRLVALFPETCGELEDCLRRLWKARGAF